MHRARDESARGPVCLSDNDDDDGGIDNEHDNDHASDSDETDSDDDYIVRDDGNDSEVDASSGSDNDQPAAIKGRDEPAKPRRGRSTVGATAGTGRGRSKLFPADPNVPRRVLAFDIGIVNLAYAVVTLTGSDDLVIETLAAANILDDDPPDGPLSDERVLAAAADIVRNKGKRKPRAKKGAAAAAAHLEQEPKQKKRKRSKDVPMKVLTERVTAFLWARADRLLGQRPHAIAIEQQAKRALKLCSMAYVIQAFLLNYYRARGEEAPPIFIQSGRQKLRVVWRGPCEKDLDDALKASDPTRCGTHAPLSAPRLARGVGGMGRFLVAPRSTQKVAVIKQTHVVPAPLPSRYRAQGGGTAAATATSRKRRWTKADKDAAHVIYQENKRQAKETFACIVRYYKGCQRWVPLYESVAKKDDLADAVLHAVFLLKAGGTRLARTKNMDETALIVLPVSAPPVGPSLSASASSSSSLSSYAIPLPTGLDGFVAGITDTEADTRVLAAATTTGNAKKGAKRRTTGAAPAKPAGGTRAPAKRARREPPKAFVAETNDPPASTDQDVIDLVHLGDGTESMQMTPIAVVKPKDAVGDMRKVTKTRVRRAPPVKPVELPRRTMSSDGDNDSDDSWAQDLGL